MKLVAFRNIESMSVTLETFHPEMSPLKLVAFRNIESMSVTVETSHPEMSPLKLVAFRNIESMSVTPDRSGVSVALYTMLDAPRNADLHGRPRHVAPLYDVG